jgi:hypothetical protein
MKFWGALVGAAAAVALLCWWIAPAVVNGDGLGYLNAAVRGELYPGHLAYLPLLRVVRAIAHAGPRPVEGLAAARLLSAISAGVAVAAVAACARRLGGDARVAGLGLAASFGLLSSGSDVETYAPALAALCLALLASLHQRTWLAALGLAAAVLLHLENVLFGLPLLLLAPKRERVLLIALSVGAVAAAYVVAGFSPASLLGASHGFHYPLHWYTPAVAVYGAAKALLFAPYPYEASWANVLGHVVPGAAALLALGAIAASTKPPLGRAATATWAIPYASVGLLFFASDAERWIFLLPLVWLSVAAANRARISLALAAALLVLNLIVWLPRAKDTTWRDRARAAGTHAQAGDLIVSPGHGWDEYLGFYEGVDVGHFPLVFHAGRLGSAQAMKTQLAEDMRDARKRGHRVLLVRFDDAVDPMGWKELLQFGITRTNWRALLPDGETLAPLGDDVTLSSGQ